jgi:uncharacterized protein (DUF1330 family)
MIDKCTSCTRKYTRAMLIDFDRSKFCIQCFNKNGYEHIKEKKNVISTK